MILYALYGAAIFFPCQPYIWSTTVLHDSGFLYFTTLGFGITDGIHSHLYSTTSPPLYFRLITESSDPGKALQTGFIKAITYYSCFYVTNGNNVRVPRSSGHRHRWENPSPLDHVVIDLVGGGGGGELHSQSINTVQGRGILPRVV